MLPVRLIDCNRGDDTLPATAASCCAVSFVHVSLDSSSGLRPGTSAIYVAATNV